MLQDLMSQKIGTVTPQSGSKESPRAAKVAKRIHDIRFRPIEPGDWTRLQRFHQRLSPVTVHLRFHGAKQQLSEPLAHRLTQFDSKNEFGIVASTGTRGRIVGVARYFRLDTDSAEVAFVVQDEYQHQGIGKRLMRRLRAHALQNGITHFYAEVLPGNAPMLRVLEGAGSASISYRGGVLEVIVDLVSKTQASRNPQQAVI